MITYFEEKQCFLLFDGDRAHGSGHASPLESSRGVCKLLSATSGQRTATASEKVAVSSTFSL